MRMTSALGSGEGEAGWNWHDPQHHLASRDAGVVPHRHFLDQTRDRGRGLPEYEAAGSNKGLHANVRRKTGDTSISSRR